MATIEIRDVLDNETGKTIFPRTHVDAVIGLKDASYFDLVPDTQDPTKFSVKLKPEYTGLWAEGWVASGGVGSQGGGGGVSSYLDDLSDVTVPSPYNGNLLSWDSSARDGLGAWVDVSRDGIASLVNGSSNSTLTVGNSSVTLYSSSQVDSLLSNIDLADYGAALSLGSVATYLKDANGKFVVDANGKYIVTAGSSTSINLVNGSGVVISSVALPSANASEILSSYVPTSRTINGHPLTSDITLSAVNDLGVAQWAMGGGGDTIPFSILPGLYTAGTKVTDSAAKGTMLGINAISNDLSSTGAESSLIKWENGAWHFYGNLYAEGWIASGGIGNGGGGAVGSFYGLPEIGVNTTTLASGQILKYDGTHWTNTAIKTINGNPILGPGDITISSGTSYTAGTGINISSGTISLKTATSSAIGGLRVGSVISTPTLESITSTANRYYQVQCDSNGRAFVNVPWTGGGTSEIPVASQSSLGGIKVGSVISTPSINSPSTTAGKYYYIQCDSNGLAFVNVPWVSGSGGGGTLTEVGLAMPNCFSVSNSPLTSNGTISVSFASQNAGLVLASPASESGTPSFRALVANDIPDLSSTYVPTSRTINGVNLSTNRTFYTLGTALGSSAAQGTLLGVSTISNALSSSNSDTTRIAWDSDHSAWHVYGNLYADGWVAAGGIGASTYTPIVLLNDVSEMPANPDENTLYLIKKN